MKVRKRKNRRKIVYAYSKPAPLVGFVIVIVVTALVYSYLVYSCQILGDEIKRMERQQVELKNRYINEECRWMEEKAPAKIAAALKRHNIVMTWPTANQVVHLSTPTIDKQNIASLDSRLIRGSRLTGTVMND